MTKRNQWRAPSLIAQILILLSSSCPTQAVGKQGESPAAEPTERLEAALDAVLGKAVAEGDVPGAVVVVVNDGRIVLARGYGVANLQNRTPVNPERTLFYLASVTKPFTATAVMQLVEQGRLDLQADVNTYLRAFRVESRFSEPITLAHLLTHTAGFDDKNIGYVAHTADEAQPLGDYLARSLPPRVRPPGQVTAYSNHGYGLAGHIVEVVSGTPYPQYVEENILRPLGMQHSTARIPLPAELERDRATGYQKSPFTGQWEPQLLGFRNLSPAGTICATAMDVARFLLAHLQDGRYEDRRILGAETIQRMHRRQFAHDPRLPGVAFGFYETHAHGIRVLQHAGGYIGYGALLALVPEENLGVFVANNGGRIALSRQAVGAALDVTLPPGAPARARPTPMPDAAARAARFAGYYHSTRYSRSSVEKIAIWDGQVRVTPTRSGTVELQPRNSAATEWVEIDPLLFQQVGGSERIAFREDASGQITHMFRDAGDFPTAFEKLRWTEALDVQLPFLLSLSAIFLSTFTLWPLAAGIRWAIRRRRGEAAQAGAPRMAVAAAVLVGFLAIVFFAGMDAMLGNSRYRLQLVYGMTTGMVVLLCVPLVITALVPVLGYYTAHSWRRRQWSRVSRIYYSLVALASLALVLFFLQWNLLGFRY